MSTRPLTAMLSVALGLFSHAAAQDLMHVPMLLVSPLSAQGAGMSNGIPRARTDHARLPTGTPGRETSAMGLDAGDRAVSMNAQVPLQGTASPSMQAAPAPAPAPEGCGYVSEWGAHPRVSERVFPAVVTRIDGRSTPLSRVNRHRVDAGPRALVVQETIDGNRFSTFGLQERQRLLRRQGARRYKVLIVDIEPNTRYEIGARLLSNPPQVDAIRDNSYWEPVAWRKTTEACH